MIDCFGAQKSAAENHHLSEYSFCKRNDFSTSLRFGRNDTSATLSLFYFFVLTLAVPVDLHRIWLIRYRNGL